MRGKKPTFFSSSLFSRYSELSVTAAVAALRHPLERLSAAPVRPAHPSCVTWLRANEFRAEIEEGFAFCHTPWEGAPWKPPGGNENDSTVQSSHVTAKKNRRRPARAIVSA